MTASARRGPAGIAGAQGPAGPSGSVWREGTAAPQNGTGADNDFYYQTNTGNVYQRQTGAYVLVSNIGGAHWSAGNGVPSGSLGADGDMYLDNLTGNVYQRVTGAWGIVANIRGPQGPAGGASFAGGTISGVTHMITGDPTHDQFVIEMPAGESAYPFLIESDPADTVNTERRWFMAHPEGGLCLTSAREPNWAILHLYKYSAAQVKNIIRITNELAAGPQDLFVVDKNGCLVMTPRDANADIVTISDSGSNLLLKIDKAGVVTGRSASRLLSSTQLQDKAMGVDVSTFPLGSAAGVSVAASSGEMRQTFIGVKGGKQIIGVKTIIDNVIAGGLTLCRIGLYNQAFALVASTGDIKGDVNGHTGELVENFTTPYTPAADAVCYVGMLSVGTTPPGIISAPGGAGQNHPVNGVYSTWRQLSLADLPAPAVRADGNAGNWFGLF